ncbi:MAG TPA: 3-hydroxyacyl-ACP dehydratase FabZ [Fimbriimonas sp.]|nr:3-hydroxyacyl-ACP dehydratase FabZ [Fimbriimonas sp.]
MPEESDLIDIQQILESLPHRYPILLVDRLLEVNEAKTHGIGLKNVTFNEPFFQGHYPGMPIMPGVLIIEAIAQTAAAIMLMNPEHAGKVPILGGVENGKFKRMVIPGDQLLMEVEILWIRNSVGKGRGTAKVDGELAASADLLFKLAPRNS